MATVSTIMKHVHMGTIDTVFSLLDGQYEFLEAKILETSDLVNKSVKDSNLPEDIITFLANLEDPENVLDVAIASLCPSGSFKQKLLETASIENRYRYFLNFLEEKKGKDCPAKTVS